MIKVLVFIVKRADVTLDQFIRYYEDHHVPMVEELLPYYAGYRRNYMMEGLYPQAVSRPFDAVTELIFAGPADYEAWMTALQQDSVIAQIREDERNFLDSSATTMWRVQEAGRS